MLIGIGTDIVEIARIRKLLEGSAGRRFLERVLTEEERALAKQRSGRLAEFAAGRFAAKEAVVKALGCGIGGEVGFHDLQILPDANGKPICCISAASLQRLGFTDSLQTHLSISHSQSYAISFAAAEIP
ncbi:holo-ACP synthase [Ferviditalea candida]|uniref:Holo-[acyl-carrier-protein] synthase n=1 Tax=Ferviditalea candida TaxID=3108399 RepID=A0ABU5ZKW1_9BACL|nr:holo-ACP synthase [Paenibacillaceae bacterium T2]